jgi:hypothetical protein
VVAALAQAPRPAGGQAVLPWLVYEALGAGDRISSRASGHDAFARLMCGLGEALALMLREAS